MKKTVLLAFILLLVAGSAFAQSAKFAAVYSEEPVVAFSDATACDPEIEDPYNPAGVDGFDMDIWGSVLFATMKMPEGKEILAGISTESLILLNTKVKGKNGGSGTAAGLGLVEAKVFAWNTKTHKAYPAVPNGKIVLNARYQQLDATLGGVIEECTDSDENGTITVADECVVTPEEIGLLTASASANHFNVVFKDLPQGTYKIIAFFKVLSTAYAEATLDACAHADSLVVLGDRIVTLQDVRAVKDSIDAVDIVFEIY